MKSGDNVKNRLKGKKMIWVNDCFRSEVGRDGSVGSTAGGRRSQTERSTFPDLEANVPRPGGRRFQFGRLWSVDVFIDGD